MEAPFLNCILMRNHYSLVSIDPELLLAATLRIAPFVVRRVRATVWTRVSVCLVRSHVHTAVLVSVTAHSLGAEALARAPLLIAVDIVLVAIVHYIKEY